MEDHRFHSVRHRASGLSLATIILVAVICLVSGLIISAQFDLSGETIAQIPTNISQTGAFPVVERNGELESPFVSVVERVTNAVVNVSARSENQEWPWWYHGGMGMSSGSGFFFREDGYILTNNHVVKDAAELIVRTASGYEYPAKLVGSDPFTDLAVIKVEPEEKVTVIPFGNSNDLKVGDWAIAIGNPFPQQGLERTVTVGVISAKGRSNLRFGDETPRFQNYIQTDASINPGNSGGPLINLRGECVGVNAAISSPTGSSVGIGFAIPINIARAVVPDLIASGKVSRGWLGVWLSDLTVRDAKRLGLAAVRGVKIDSVFLGSPAEKAGIRRGDVIVKFNGDEVDNSDQFSVLVSTVKTGNTVPVRVLRDGDEIGLQATVADQEQFLAANPASGRRTRTAPSGGSVDWLGMQLVNFTPEVARQLGIPHVEGVYVARVYPNTPADRASITEGTIIMQVNTEPVTSTTDIVTVDQGISDRSRVPLIVQEPDGSVARKVVRP
ncbi:MAG: trypsin-like peptidase domain-containing protein [bacterium]|nr:trypsin-like peptidase domain-containing protein [bacterium]